MDSNGVNRIIRHVYYEVSIITPRASKTRVWDGERESMETIPAWVWMTNDNLNIEPGSQRTCPIKSQRAPVTTARYFMWTNPDPGGHPVSPASIMQPQQIVFVNGHSWRHWHGFYYFLSKWHLRPLIANGTLGCEDQWACPGPLCPNVSITGQVLMNIGLASRQREKSSLRRAEYLLLSPPVTRAWDASHVTNNHGHSSATGTGAYPQQFLFYV